MRTFLRPLAAGPFQDEGCFEERFALGCAKQPPFCIQELIKIPKEIISFGSWEVRGSISAYILWITREESRWVRRRIAAYVCSGYCLCRSDRMKEQWVSFQFLMSTSNYLFNFMPGEALYSYMQKHFTSFVMLCFGCHWLAFQLTALITTWIWLCCRGINIMQQSIYAPRFRYSTCPNTKQGRGRRGED